MFYTLTITLLGSTLTLITAGELECHNIAQAVVEGYASEGIEVVYTCEPEES